MRARRVPGLLAMCRNRYAILDTIATMAVISNGVLVFFVGDLYRDRSWVTRTTYFLVFEHLILACKIGLGFVVPDVTESTEIQLERQEFIKGKVIDNLADDGADEIEDKEHEGAYDIADEDPDPAFEGDEYG